MSQSAGVPVPADHPPGALRSGSHLLGILRVLARHGFVRALRGKGRWPTPVQVREALEELGVVFLKFGQVLGVLRDLLPDAYVIELERLHDRLPAMPSEVVARHHGHGARRSAPAPPVAGR